MLTTLPNLLRLGGEHAQAARIESDVARRLTEQDMIRLGFEQGQSYVVEDDGTLRKMTLVEAEDLLDLQENI